MLDTNSDYKQLVTIGNLVKKYPYLQAFLSFGGWTKSTHFSTVMNNATYRHTFEDQAIAAMQEVGFNGIDIDWEYPVIGPQGLGPSAPEDADNYGIFVTELRAKLDAAEQVDGKKYYISLAVSAGIDKISKLSPAQWGVIAKAINYLNIMSYDFHGAFDYSTTKPQNSIADFQSAMNVDGSDPTIKDPTLMQYAVTNAIRTFLTQGFNANQIIMGMPAYGRMVNVTHLAGDYYGLYQPLTSVVPAGQYDDAQSGPTGVFDYACIVTALRGGKCKGYTPTGLILAPTTSHVKYASQSNSQWAYTASNQVITYDDVAGITAKTQWIKDQKLGGAMFWSLSGDLPITDPQSLIAAVSASLAI